MNVIIPAPTPTTGPAVATLPPLPCVPAMGSIMFPAMSGQLNADFHNFAFNGPFNPGIGWGFHFEGSVPLYEDAGKTIIDGRASAAVSLRGISSLLRRVTKSNTLEPEHSQHKQESAHVFVAQTHTVVHVSAYAPRLCVPR